MGCQSWHMACTSCYLVLSKLAEQQTQHSRSGVFSKALLGVLHNKFCFLYKENCNAVRVTKCHVKYFFLGDRISLIKRGKQNQGTNRHEKPKIQEEGNINKNSVLLSK